MFVNGRSIWTVNGLAQEQQEKAGRKEREKEAKEGSQGAIAVLQELGCMRECMAGESLSLSIRFK